jgi:hypothetical protein
MPHGSRKLSIVSFVVYAAVVVLLLSLAVFARGFSVSIGDILLSGRYVPLPLLGSQKVRDLTLSYRGLELRLSRSLPLSVRSGEKESSVALDSVRSSAEGADILFEGGASLHLAPQAGSRAVYTLVPVSSSAARFSLLIPFSIQGHLQQTPGTAGYWWSLKGQKYLLTLPEGSQVDPASGTVLLAARTGSAADSVQLAASEVSAEAPPSGWRQSAALPGTEDFQKEVSRFSDAAYAGWSQKRLSADRLTWVCPDGKYRFVEDIGPALISESISRGAFPQSRALFADALAERMRADPEASLSLSASAYTGNTRDYLRRLQARVPVELDRVRRLLAAKDPSVFTPGIVAFLLDHAQPSLLEDLHDFLLAQDPARADTAAATGMLDAFLDYDSLVASRASERRKFGQLIDRALMPRLRNTDAGVFLASGSGNTVALAGSLRCGTLFIRAGATLEKPAVAATGRGLVVSALAQLQETGFLPSEIEISPEGVSRRRGGLAPEELYGSLAAGELFPREIPLARSLGQGAWIYTAADMAMEDSSASGFTMALSFPVGLAHYLVIQGVKPFSQLRLHGIPWRPDPSYFQYTDGYSYDAASRTLSMKITPRQAREEVAVIYATD